VLDGWRRRDALDGRVLGEIVELPLAAHADVEMRRNAVCEVLLVLRVLLVL
jgi:hypothetical protein